MPDPSRLVLIPSYNTGPRVLQTVREARAAWDPVWVVVDGSTDGTDALLLAEAATDPGLEVMVLPRNGGKGGAVLHGLREAARRGFTHALTMDADGQHPASRIAAMMEASRTAPEAMILGRPVFGPEAPQLRVQGRRISNGLASLQTLGGGIGDCLFGFRVYPVGPLVAVMERHRWMRRFDFDPEAAVRLAWRGVPAVNLPVPVRYLSAEEGGVSHFHYARDNLLLTWMHTRLVLGMLPRLPALLWRRRRAVHPPLAAAPRR
ncbi:glycosyltransferase family 2 protein [Belnapia rosea]|uniref:glycosyltransferase family 2 protein n=1 Tax=Belnapia rosea TaxID=938405 RepID=UPI0008843775|nr:glycosyltransferase family 2 protein [Belnapia rosea]SDB63754.1 Glycosyltransferase involved in cell wall bisynthesis [Belnapia rosea]